MGHSPRDFSFSTRKDGSIVISHRGRPVRTLTEHRAQRFTAAADGADDATLQMLMAKATGNFKRGNERRI